MYIKTLIGLIKGKLSNKSIPLKVEHIISYNCNFKCSYCNLWDIKTKELSTQEIKNLMDYFSKKGTISWNFTGGEPLLREDIKELVEYGKKLKFYITLNTNGSLIKQNISWLNKIDLLGISLDAIEEHNKTRNKTSKEIIDAVKLLKDNKINVYICSVLNKYNLKNEGKELKELLNLTKELDVPLSPLPIFKHESNKERIDELIPLEEEFKNGIEILKKFKKKNKRNLLISNSTLKYLENGFPLSPIKCYAGKYFLTLYPDGKLSPCMFLPKVESLDKLKEVGKVNCNENGFNCQLCYLEYNNLFSLKPGTLYELIKNK